MGKQGDKQGDKSYTFWECKCSLVIVEEVFVYFCSFCGVVVAHIHKRMLAVDCAMVVSRLKLKMLIQKIYIL
ncbi:MAG: YgiT-type zinc finger protein [Rickettsiales bacterium]|nr:YgiT-type zinc finger protein [Rickettsiales bacterium]